MGLHRLFKCVKIKKHFNMRCIVPHCNHSSNRAASRGITFHRFPSEPTLRAVWLRVLGRHAWQPLPSTGVCSLHFLTDDLRTNSAGQRRLRAGAVPVIKAQIKDESLKSNEENANVQPSNTEIIHNQRDVNDIKIEYVEENVYIGKHVKDDTVVANIKVEKDDTVNQDGANINTDYMTYLPNVEGITHNVNYVKVERVDNAINQELENRSNLQKENVITDIKIEMDQSPTINSKDRTTENAQFRYFHENKTVNNIKFEWHDTVKPSGACETNENDIRVEFNDNMHTDSHNDKPEIPISYNYTVKVEEHNLKEGAVSDEPEVPNNVILTSSSGVENFTLSYEVKIEEEGIKECPEEVSIDNGVQDGRIKEGNHCGNTTLDTQNPLQRNCIANGNEVREVHNRTKEDGQRKPDHEKFHVNTRLSCDACPYQTAHEKQLRSHLNAHAATTSYRCDQCYYLTTKQECLRAHTKTHSTQKAYTCNTCKKSFKERGGIIRHLRIHTGEKRYKCDVCKKRFQEQHDLKLHLRTHSGAKPFACEICNKCFSERGNLFRHLNMHSGLKPHSCGVCNKSFLQKHHMKRHLKMHAREQLYYCDLCKRDFMRKCSLYNHLKWCEKNIADGVTAAPGFHSYCCHHCKKVFGKKSSLNNHLRWCSKNGSVRSKIVKSMAVMRKKQG